MLDDQEHLPLSQSPPSQSAQTEVTCYAGTRYAERPRTFTYRGRQLEVAKVERSERAPGGPRFRVRSADGRRFWLSYREATDTWWVRLSQPAAGEGHGPWAR